MGTACAVRHGKGACICARGALNPFIYPEHGKRTSVPPQKNSPIPAISASKCHLKGAVAIGIPRKEGLKCRYKNLNIYRWYVAIGIPRKEGLKSCSGFSVLVW